MTTENQTYIPEDWILTNFGDKQLFEILGSGITFFEKEKDYYSTSSIEVDKLIEVEQVISYRNRPSRANMQPVPNSVWFAKMKNTLKVIQPDQYQIDNVIFSTGFCGIKANNIDCSYLFQVLKSEDFNTKKDNLAEGTTQVAVNNQHVRNIEFLLPCSILEQQKIASILSKIDEAITQTEQLIEKYKKIKEGLMHDLLTRGIDEQGNIRSEETHKFKDSPLGRIPEEWEVKKLIDLCIKIVDCPHSTPNYLEEGVLVARTQNIKQGRYLIETSSYVCESEYLNRVSRLIPEYGDIIFTREAPIGEAFVIPKEMKICLGQRVMLFRVNSNLINSEFLVELIYSEWIKRIFDSINGGSTVSHLNVEDVKKLFFLKPPLNEQKQIMKILDKTKESINSHIKIKEMLQLQKSGLMHDLLTGKVRVQI